MLKIFFNQLLFQFLCILNKLDFFQINYDVFSFEIQFTMFVSILNAKSSIFCLKGSIKIKFYYYLWNHSQLIGEV